MILEQYYLGCLSHASYLAGDEKSGTGVVVDPQRDVGQYIADAERLGLRIRHVFLTHFHADFVAGHLELRDRTGAEICMGARAEAEFDFRGFSDGQTLELDTVRLRILETPGHTPEAISILVFDLAQSADEPHAVLTGDTLFIGDVGRPDLMASRGVGARDLAEMLYDSLHTKLLPLPDATLVYPAHGAGSLCGKNLSRETVSTLGEQRRYNYALQPMTKPEFVRLVTTDLPASPAYFAYDAELNRRERETLDGALAKSLRALSLEDVTTLAARGAQLLDTRDPRDFAAGHLRGSVNVGLGGQYASWCGTLLDRKRPIVLITDPGREHESALRLGRIGFDQVTGHLEGGPEALVSHPEKVESFERVTALALSELLGSPEAPLVLDVRTDRERSQKRIEPSLHVPLDQLEGRLDEIPRNRNIVVHCAGGYRSAMAVSLLQRDGDRHVTDLVGGVQAWEASRLAIQGGDATTEFP